MAVGLLGVAVLPSLQSRRNAQDRGPIGRNVGMMQSGSGWSYMMPYYGNQAPSGIAPGPSPAPARFQSDAERAYYTATSSNNRPITATFGTMHLAYGMSCAHCHGSTGSGGSVNLAVGVAQTPPITWSALAKARKGGTFGSRPSYDEAKLRRALQRGVGAGGRALRAPMPRWSLSDTEAKQLAAYLRTIR